MPTYKSINVTEGTWQGLCEAVTCDRSRHDKLKAALSHLSGRFEHMKTTGLTPRQEAKALSDLWRRIKAYLEADTIPKSETAKKKLSSAFKKYTDQFGNHRHWLNNAVIHLLTANSAPTQELDWLEERIARLYKLPTGSLQNSYLIQELLCIFEEMSDEPAMQFRSNYWYDKRTNYKASLKFLKLALPLFELNRIPSTRALEKRLVRVYPRLKARKGPIHR